MKILRDYKMLSIYLKEISQFRKHIIGLLLLNVMSVLTIYLFDHKVDNNSLQFQFLITLVFSAFIGFLQISKDNKNEQWVILLQGPVSKARVFVTKILAGLTAILFFGVIPYILTSILISMPGYSGEPLDITTITIFKLASNFFLVMLLFYSIGLFFGICHVFKRYLLVFSAVVSIIIGFLYVSYLIVIGLNKNVLLLIISLFFLMLGYCNYYKDSKKSNSIIKIILESIIIFVMFIWIDSLILLVHPGADINKSNHKIDIYPAVHGDIVYQNKVADKTDYKILRPSNLKIDGEKIFNALNKRDLRINPASDPMTFKKK